MFLGAYLEKKTGRKMHIWMGECHVHAGIDPAEIGEMRVKNPDADFLIHPECGCVTQTMYRLGEGDISSNGTHILSTEGMVRHAKASAAQAVRVVATETGILHRLKKEVPAQGVHSRLARRGVPVHEANHACPRLCGRWSTWSTRSRCPRTSQRTLAAPSTAWSRSADEPRLRPALQDGLRRTDSIDMKVRQPAPSSDEFFYRPEGEGGRKRARSSERTESSRRTRKHEVETIEVPALSAAETVVARPPKPVPERLAPAPLPAAPKPKRSVFKSKPKREPVAPQVASPPPAPPAPPKPKPARVVARPAVVAPPPPLPVAPPPPPTAPEPVEEILPSPVPSPMPPAPTVDVNAPGSAPAAPGPAPTRWKKVGGMLVPEGGPLVEAPPATPIEPEASAPTEPQPLSIEPPPVRLAVPQAAAPQASSPFAIADSEPSAHEVVRSEDREADDDPPITALPSLRQDFKRRRRGRLLPALIAGLLVSGAAGYFAINKSFNDGELVSFRYSYASGDKRTYDMTMEMNMKPAGLPDAAPFEGTMNATMNLDVVSKAEDGSTVIDIKMSNVALQPNLNAGPGDVGKMRVTIAPDGRVTRVEGVGGPFGAAGIDVGSFLNIPGGGATDGASSQFLFPQFPSEGVRPGDSWTEETVMPLPFSDVPIKVKTEGTFEGYQQTLYGQAARMHHVVTMPMNFDFTLAQLFQSMAAVTEGGAPPVPLEAQSARFVVSGSMKMITDSLVLPDGGDIAKMVGTTDMDLNMRIDGVPADQLEGSPGEFSMAGTTKMTIIRTDGQTSS